MAVTRSAEGHKIVQRLLDQIADERTLTETSGNTLKKIKRGLGALLFSPDSLGYIDIIEKGLSQNKTGVQILRSVASRSEKVVKSYSPLTGAFEAHHIIALNSLRDAFIQLPPAEQDEFLKMLDDKGWKIGDDPKQLMNTVFTRESHLGQSTQPKPGDVGAQREVKLTMGENIPKLKGMDAHAGKPFDASLQAKPVSTAAELFEQFDGPTGIAGRSIDQAQNALFQDEGFRAFMETKGFPLDNVTPEIIDSYYNDPIKTRGMFTAMQEAALEAENIPLKEVTQIKGDLGVDVRTRGADPSLVKETTGKFVTMRGMADEGIAYGNRILRTLKPIVNNPIVGQTPAGRVVRGAVAGAGLYGDIAQAKEGFTAATTQTNRLRQTAGQLDVLAGGMGLTGLSLPAAVIPGLMAQHLRNRADVQQEAADEVAAIEGTKPAPVLDFTPEIVPTENLGGTERRRRRRDAERAEAAAVN